MATTGFTDKDITNQSGRCFMVTGANTGLGFEVANVLARKGARVLLACRNQAKAEQAIAGIKAENPAADLAFIPLDQSELASVHQAASLAAQEPRLDGLINNAGIMASFHATTKDGFEHHFGVNHLATFALTLLLLPKLNEIAGSRVVVTSSLAHRSGRDAFTPDAAAHLKPMQHYSNSKLANLLFMLELSRRLQSVSANTIATAGHPGIAATELFRNSSWPLKAFTPLFRNFFNTSLQGAWPTLQAACDPNAHSGDFFGPQNFGGARGPSGPATPTPLARSETVANQLWQLSEQLTGVHFPL